MGEESIRNIVHDCGNVDLPPLTEDVQKRCMFAYGERDGNCRTARRVQPLRYSRATLRVWEGFDHCKRITRDTEGYVRMIEQLLTD